VTFQPCDYSVAGSTSGTGGHRRCPPVCRRLLRWNGGSQSLPACQAHPTRQPVPFPHTYTRPRAHTGRA
jgi:hypothetical protein